MSTIKSARDGYVTALRQIVTEKETALRTATIEFEKARTELASVTGTTFVPKAAKGKPGPKPGSKRTTTAKTATPKGKPGPKPGSKRTATKTAPNKAKEKAPKTAKRTSKASDGNGSSGRSGPSLKESIASIIGTRDMDVSGVLEGLTKKNLMPECQNERGYVSWTLSQNKDVFERVTRGVYRVIDGTVFKPRGAKAQAEAQTSTVAKPIRRARKTDAQKLQELGATGSGATANPFSS